MAGRTGFVLIKEVVPGPLFQRENTKQLIYFSKPKLALGSPITKDQEDTLGSRPSLDYF
jgi:hypothetical protein